MVLLFHTSCTSFILWVQLQVLSSALAVSYELYIVYPMSTTASVVEWSCCHIQVVHHLSNDYNCKCYLMVLLSHTSNTFLSYEYNYKRFVMDLLSYTSHSLFILQVLLHVWSNGLAFTYKSCSDFAVRIIVVVLLSYTIIASSECHTTTSVIAWVLVFIT